MSIPELITTLLVSSGILGGIMGLIVWVVKKYTSIISADSKVNREIIQDVIENNKNDSEKLACAVEKNSESIVKLADTMKSTFFEIAEKSGDGHHIVSKKLDEMIIHCQKSTTEMSAKLTTQTDYLVKEITEIKQDFRLTQMKTEDLIKELNMIRARLELTKIKHK